MKKISLQWRLTCIITLYIALVCGCLTLLIYKNGIYYIDSLQETVDARGDDVGERRYPGIHILKIHISTEMVLGISVHSHIDHNRAFFYVLCCDHLRLSDCCDQNICSACHFF